jgi:phosphoserine phosphatase
MALIATLVTSPQTPVLSREAAARAADAARGRVTAWLSEGVACDIALAEGSGAAQAEAALREALADLPVDVAVQQAEGRRKRLLIADMDSTMIQQECIDELADMAGVKAHVSAITARAMNGEIAFEPALRERVALLKGLPVTIIADVLRERITFMPGGRVLVATMKANGGFAALVSGGFTAFTRPVAAALGFDANRANVLHERGGVLAGTVAEPILGREAKVEALDAFCAELGITPADAIAVGDGANDLGMLQKAGSGVALHAKPSVAAQAKIRIDHGDLTALLYLQGYGDAAFIHPAA